MEFRILGPLEIADGERVLALGGPKRRAVAAALLLEANRVVASERLIDLVWGDEPPAWAQGSLQNHVLRLRRELGDRVATRAPGYVLRVEPGELDLEKFRSLVDRARAARPAAATALLDEALALWRGEPLADLADEPVGAGATHLGELRLEAVELRNDAELALGRHAALLPGLETLVAAHPFRERFRAQLLLALYRSGRQADALDAYATARSTLVDELGTEPSAELQELQRAILNQDASLAAPTGATPRTNLPVPTTAFLGREQELAGVVSLLCREDVRLLTLTGPGGTGKTRLALRAAAEVADDYPDGIWWVPLATLRDPQLVVETAAQAMGTAGNLAEHVADKIVLVLFDNFEQVVAAATAIGELLGACPKLKLLVTSREPLRLLAEQEYPVPSFTPADSVDFFIARARAARPDFVPGPEATEICRRLDDLPLAVELAAARVRTLNTAQILERLENRLPLLTGGARDVPERQRTLTAAITWSYELLAPDEQRAFARLAVFRGGCTLSAAERVADVGPDTLQSLAERSLLRAGDERYWMLETIREYARERLDGSDEVARIRRSHAEHYLTLAEEMEPHVREEWVHGGGERLDELEREHDNLRAALDWLERHGETDRALRLAAALSEFWIAHNHPEGLRRLEQTLHAEEALTAARAKALNALSLMLFLRGDLETMRLRAEEALAIYRMLEHERGTADSLYVLGTAAAAEHDVPRAQQFLDKSARLYRELGENDTALWARRGLAQAYAEAGDLDHARAVFEEELERAHTLGNPGVEAALLESLASLALMQGCAADAFPLLERSLGIAHDLGDAGATAGCLCHVSAALAALGQSRTAAQLLSFVEVTNEIGGAQPWVAQLSKETRETLLSQLDAAAFAEAWEEGQALSVDLAVRLGLESMRVSLAD